MENVASMVVLALRHHWAAKKVMIAKNSVFVAMKQMGVLQLKSGVKKEKIVRKRAIVDIIPSNEYVWRHQRVVQKVKYVKNMAGVQLMSQHNVVYQVKTNPTFKFDNYSWKFFGYILKSKQTIWRGKIQLWNSVANFKHYDLTEKWDILGNFQTICKIQISWHRN